MRYEEEGFFKNHFAPLSVAPRNPGNADTAYTSANSTHSSAHSLRSTALTARRALNRMFTGKRDCGGKPVHTKGVS
jgi:hypothetical protein